MRSLSSIQVVQTEGLDSFQVGEFGADVYEFGEVLIV